MGDEVAGCRKGSARSLPAILPLSFHTLTRKRALIWFCDQAPTQEPPAMAGSVAVPFLPARTMILSVTRLCAALMPHPE